MGSFYEAVCECGFTADVTVGGGRHTFHENSRFPFYCQHCGLVSVNIASLPDDCVTTVCPECGDQNATQYGVRPVSEHDLRPQLKKFWPLWRKEDTSKVVAALQWGNRKAAATGHLCPACQRMTLEFSSMPSVLYD
jgi:hypothetical protein